MRMVAKRMPGLRAATQLVVLAVVVAAEGAVATEAAVVVEASGRDRVHRELDVFAVILSRSVNETYLLCLLLFSQR